MNGARRWMGMGAAIVLIGWAASAGATGTMQKAPSGTMQKSAPGGATTSTPAAPPVKVEAQALSLTPAQPKAGDQVTVKLTIRNTGTGTVAKVPWSIHLYTGNQTLAQGEQANLAAGASVDVTAQWTAKAGEQRLQGYVDPKGNALKNTAPVAAQVKELTLTVPQAATKAGGTASAPLVTELLDYQKAKYAGAQFAHNVDGATACWLGQEDLKSTGWAFTGRGQSGVVFHIDCAPGGIPAPSGGRATPEAFTGFGLKHGWKVKKVEIVDEIRVGTGEWLWRQRPGEGTSNPGMKMHVWANIGGRYAVAVKVTIEGPQGTNPYE